MAAFLGGFGGLVATRAAKGALPERMSLYDLALAGIAGHKLSRLIVTDEVTAPLRAPFVIVSEDEKGDKKEEPRGDGPRRAIGELVTCPSCVGQWATAAFVLGLVTAPRVTRLAGSVFVGRRDQRLPSRRIQGKQGQGLTRPGVQPKRGDH